MTRGSSAWVIASMLVVSVMAAPVAAAPTDKGASPSADAAARPLSEALTGDAKQAYESGKLLYTDGDFAGALLKFQQAYNLSHDPRLLWNMAVCEKNLRHYARLLPLVERYLAEAGAVMTEADRAEATDLARAVRAFVGTISVQCPEPGVALSVDGERVATTPLPAPLKVDMGTRKLRFSKLGFVDHELVLQVGGGGNVEAACKLDKVMHAGRLSIVAAPNEAIWIDSKPVGTGRWEGMLAPGGYQVRVTAQGKRAWQSEVVLKDKETRELRVMLENETAASGGLPAWVWIAGGVAIVAAGAVGGYFAFRPKDEAAPPAVAGTMQPGTVQIPLLGR